MVPNPGPACSSAAFFFKKSFFLCSWVVGSRLIPATQQFFELSAVFWAFWKGPQSLSMGLQGLWTNISVWFGLWFSLWFGHKWWTIQTTLFQFMSIPISCLLHMLTQISRRLGMFHIWLWKYLEHFNAVWESGTPISCSKRKQEKGGRKLINWRMQENAVPSTEAFFICGKFSGDLSSLQSESSLHF